MPYGPSHEKRVFIAYAKSPTLNIHTLLLEAFTDLFSVRAFTYFHSLCIQSAKIQASLRKCTGSFESSLLATFATSAKSHDLALIAINC